MDLIGRLVNHRLLGKCMLIKAPDKGLWEVRLPSTNIILVNREELDLEDKPKTRAEILREYATVCQALSRLCYEEAESLEKEKNGKLP